MKYELIIFDMDGTVLDTLHDLYSSTNHALRESGFPERSEEEVRRFVGNGIHKLIERAVPSGASAEQISKVHDDFMQYYSVHCADTTKPYDGIPELLKQLRESGIRTAVSSNKADSAVQILCKDYFPDLFDMTVGMREGIRPKPAPDSVQAILNALHISKEQALYVGDSDVDIATAQNSGIPCISVGWGFRDGAFLIQHDAKKIISVPEELLSLID